MNYLASTTTHDNNVIDTISGDAFLSPLGPNESLIWHRNLTKGIWHKHVVCREWITNYRIIRCAPYLSQIYLSNLQDVIILNQYNQSNSNFSGYSSGTRSRSGGGSSSRFMYGNSKGVNTHIGDLMFLVEGKPIIIFEKVNDPQSLVKLVKSIMSQQ